MERFGLNGEEIVISYMRKIFQDYDIIRELSREQIPCEFWDIIVLTASNLSQKKAFELQLESKKKRGELPLTASFHVVADTPECKIGCGGSTFLVLDELFSMYSEKLYEMKILLIHAGGQSQRMPSHSILGKLFSPLPLGDPMYQMLDIIIALYLPFIKRMKPGLFLVSSDAIITYALDESNPSWSFEKAGFTTLGHASPLEIGTKHGVYIIPEVSFSSTTCFQVPCIMVMQKPSVSQMYQEDAVQRHQWKGENGEDYEAEIVFTDSAFFFDNSTMQKMLNFYKLQKPINCEISSYGDFLQPLGPRSSLNYVNNVTNVVEATEELVTIRKKIYYLLKDSSVNVLVLLLSTFYHLGTMKEYIQNISLNSKFFNELGLSKMVFSSSLTGKESESELKGTIMHSLVHPSSEIAYSSIVEYCHFLIPILTGERCILSNCELEDFSNKTEASISIPSDMLFHTIAVDINNFKGFVTIAFSINDDLKKNYLSSNIEEMKYLGAQIKNIITKLNPFPVREEGKTYSLWQAKLFPVKTTMSESFIATLDMTNDLMNCLSTNKQHVLKEISYKKNMPLCLSMEECLLYKDIEKMLNYRNFLWEKLKELKN